jgi:hypothetical protein
LNASQHARSRAQYWDIPTLILDFNYQECLLLIKLVQFGLNFIQKTKILDGYKMKLNFSTNFDVDIKI